MDCHIQFNTIGNLKQFRSIITYDSDWKLDDNTEQFAFLKAAKYLPKVQGATYFGFPWATLFEFLESDRKISKHLMAVLSCAKPLLKKNKTVITVCQHPNLIKFQTIVAESAVTHVFCPHAGFALNCLPGNREVRILPFPIAPAHMRRYQHVRNRRKKISLFLYRAKNTNGSIYQKHATLFFTTWLATTGSCYFSAVNGILKILFHHHRGCKVAQ